MARPEPVPVQGLGQTEGSHAPPAKPGMEGSGRGRVVQGRGAELAAARIHSNSELIMGNSTGEQFIWCVDTCRHIRFPHSTLSFPLFPPALGWRNLQIKLQKSSRWIFTRQCNGELIRMPLPYPTSQLEISNQTQRNRPANCQTSNDEMKSNRNRSRAENREAEERSSYWTKCRMPA